MKINFITEYDGNINSGISKKVLSQVSKIREIGNACELYFITPKLDDFSKFKGVNQILYPGPPYKTLLAKIKSVLALKNILSDLLNSFHSNDAILFRLIYPFSFFSKIISNKNVFLEVVSNPIQEAKFRKSYLYYYLFTIYRKKIGNSTKGVIAVTSDLIDITFPDLNKNIPRLVVGNGIDVAQVKLSTKVNKQDKLVFTCVANISKWHGLDRFLEGLACYQDKEKIIFNIVGNGVEKNSLVALVKKLNLSNYVIFHGEKSGTELDDIFDETDIGVGNLGTFRKQIKFTSPLKSREYCARGIPFFYTCRDEDFPLDFSFAFEVEANDNPIDVNAVIDFYNKAITIDNYKKIMRNFAVNNLSWDAKMIKVVDFISLNSNKSNKMNVGNCTN